MKKIIFALLIVSLSLVPALAQNSVTMINYD
jgi:hypothetical protein